MSKKFNLGGDEMRGYKSTFCCIALGIGLFSSTVLAQTPVLTTNESVYNVGKLATVCGYVASTKFAYRSHGQPTFLNFDRPYPNQTFTALIWKKDRYHFGQPESDYLYRHICVTGRIKNYHGRPEIIVSTPSQISAQ